MPTAQWAVTKNGVTHSFSAEIEMVADFVVPCPYCGVACSGTFRTWYMHGEKRMMFETDRGSLSALLEPLVEASNDRDNYDSLPSFVRDWNEMTGWAALGVMEGAVIPAADLLATVTVLEQRTSDSRVLGMLRALRELMGAAIREGQELWVGET